MFFLGDLIRLVILFFIFYAIFGGAAVDPKNFIGWALGLEYVTFKKKDWLFSEGEGEVIQ